MSQVALITKDTEFTWCPCCGEIYMVDDDEKKEILEHESCYIRTARKPRGLQSVVVDKRKP